MSGGLFREKRSPFFCLPTTHPQAPLLPIRQKKCEVCLIIRQKKCKFAAIIRQKKCKI